MSLTAEGIAAIIVALAGFVSGIYNLMQARRVQALDDLDRTKKELDEVKDEHRETERQLEDAMRHIHAQTLILARNGLTGPHLPESLK